MFAAPSDGMFIMEAILNLLPDTTIVKVLEKLSTLSPRLAKGQATRQVARTVAKELVEEKSKEFASGQGSQFKDVFSLLSEYTDYCMVYLGKFELTDCYFFFLLSQGEYVRDREVQIER